MAEAKPPKKPGLYMLHVEELENDGISLDEMELDDDVKEVIKDYRRFQKTKPYRSHRIVLETHSENLLLRLLRRIRETTRGTVPGDLQVNSDDVALYFVTSSENGTQFKRIEIDKNGDFVEPWPDDFFEIDFYERFCDAR